MIWTMVQLIVDLVDRHADFLPVDDREDLGKPAAVVGVETRMNIHTPDPIDQSGGKPLFTVEGKDEVIPLHDFRDALCDITSRDTRQLADGGLIDVHIAMPGLQIDRQSMGVDVVGQDQYRHDSPPPACPAPISGAPNTSSPYFRADAYRTATLGPAQGHQSVRFQDPGYRIVHGQP